MPTEDKFPLWQHSRGSWAKKIDGKTHYFGRDKQEALARYELFLEERKAGLTHGPLTIRELLNSFLQQKDSQVESGELKRETFALYKMACTLIAEHFGRLRVVCTIKAHEMTKFRAELAKKYKPHTLKLRVSCIRMIFLYAYEEELISKQIKFGEMKAPKPRLLKESRIARKRPLTPAEAQYLLGRVTGPVRCMVLLGLNCALGAMDMAALRPEHVRGEWCQLPRPKTGAPRKAWLWPITRENLMLPLGPHHSIRDKLHNALVEAGVDVTVYSLRHTAIDIASQVGDVLATKVLAGHVDDSITADYIHSMDPGRIIRVCQHIWDTLFGAHTEKLKVVGA
jgi:hypothetical protein